MHDQKTLKAGEMFALVSILIGVKLTDSTASLFAQKAQNAFWFVPIIAFLVMLPALLILIYLLKKFKNKNLIELCETILGKTLGKLLGILLFLSAFFLTALDTRNYVEQIQLLYFPNSPTLFIFILLIIIIYFGAKKGIEVIGFTSRISLPFIKASILLLAGLILPQITWQRIFPIFGSGWTEVLTEGITKGAIFSEFFLLTIAYTSLQTTKQFRLGTYLGMVVVLIEITFFFFIYTTIFDYNSIEKISYPFYDITQYVDFGTFFTNIETFFMVFWLIALFLRYMILTYIIAWILGTIFHVHEFERLILPLSYLSITVGMLSDNAVINELLYRDRLLTYSTPLYVCFPFILWIVAKWKGALK